MGGCLASPKAKVFIQHHDASPSEPSKQNRKSYTFNNTLTDTYDFGGGPYMTPSPNEQLTPSPNEQSDIISNINTSPSFDTGIGSSNESKTSCGINNMRQRKRKPDRSIRSATKSWKIKKSKNGRFSVVSTVDTQFVMMTSCGVSTLKAQTPTMKKRLPDNKLNTFSPFSPDITPNFSELLMTKYKDSEQSMDDTGTPITGTESLLLHPDGLSLFQLEQYQSISQFSPNDCFSLAPINANGLLSPDASMVAQQTKRVSNVSWSTAEPSSSLKPVKLSEIKRDSRELPQIPRGSIHKTIDKFVRNSYSSKYDENPSTLDFINMTYPKFIQERTTLIQRKQTDSIDVIYPEGQALFEMCRFSLKELSEEDYQKIVPELAKFRRLLTQWKSEFQHLVATSKE